MSTQRRRSSNRQISDDAGRDRGHLSQKGFKETNIDGSTAKDASRKELCPKINASDLQAVRQADQLRSKSSEQPNQHLKTRSLPVSLITTCVES